MSSDDNVPKESALGTFCDNAGITTGNVISGNLQVIPDIKNGLIYELAHYCKITIKAKDTFMIPWIRKLWKHENNFTSKQIIDKIIRIYKRRNQLHKKNHGAPRWKEIMHNFLQESFDIAVIPEKRKSTDVPMDAPLEKRKMIHDLMDSPLKQRRANDAFMGGSSEQEKTNDAPEDISSKNTESHDHSTASLRCVRIEHVNRELQAVKPVNEKLKRISEKQINDLEHKDRTLAEMESDANDAPMGVSSKKRKTNDPIDISSIKTDYRDHSIAFSRCLRIEEVNRELQALRESNEELKQMSEKQRNDLEHKDRILAEMECDRKEKMEQLIKQHKLDIAQMRNEHREERKQREDQFRKNVEIMEKETTEIMKYRQAQLDEQYRLVLQSFKQKSQKELSVEKAKCDTKLRKLRKTYEGKYRRLKKKVEKALRNKAKFQRGVKYFRGKYENLKNDCTSRRESEEKFCNLKKKYKELNERYAYLEQHEKAEFNKQLTTYEDGRFTDKFRIMMMDLLAKGVR